MENKITVHCENTGKAYDIPTGCSLKKFKQIVFPQNHNHLLGALVNNELHDLHYEIYKPKTINFVDMTTLDGYSIYTRSTIFLLHTAIKALYPKKTLVVEHAISNGLFCRIANKEFHLTETHIQNIKAKMRELVDNDIEITRQEIPTEEAIALFHREGLKDKELLLSTRGKMYTSVYSIHQNANYFYGTLAPTTGCLHVFDLQLYKDGMLLQLPDRAHPERVLPLIPQDKLFNVFNEHRQWGNTSGATHIGHINAAIEQQYAGMLIKISEAQHEKKISQIADLIKKKHKKVKVILIAGPSSSGKTTFGKRLAIQLLVNGIKPVNLSLDNYFVNREDTPRDEKGEYDFETFDALDLDTFNDNMLRLLNGEEIEIPKFSFETGQRFYDGEKCQISSNNVLIIEGIHGLNPRLTASLPPENLFKIYISALTSISIDNHNIINPSDNRLIRRMVRDYKYRNYSALDTLKRWESVLAGEEKHITPYGEEADVIFNSALIYELGALKQQAVPLLDEVQSKYPEHSKAQRLLKFFSYIQSVPTREIPPTSILREFLGGSSFKY